MDDVFDYGVVIKHIYIIMESVCVRVYVRVYVRMLLIFSVGSKRGRKLIFGILGALTL